MQPGTGALYPLRWGAVEPPSADAVENVWGSPTYPGATCVKRNSKLGIYIDWEGGPTAQWKVLDAWLESELTGQLYFDEGPDSHGWHNANSTHWFAVRVPDFVDWSKIRGSIITYSPNQRSQTWSYENDVYTILDQPKAPMNPGWASFLPHVCTWARYRPDQANVDRRDAVTTTENDAAQRVTFGYFFQGAQNSLWPGTYYNGGIGADFLRYNNNLHKYYLRAILYNWVNGWWVPGECIDASIMAGLGMCSLGFQYNSRQITSPAGSFYTFAICPIGSDPKNPINYVPWPWNFHSITVQGGQAFSSTTPVWDSCAAQWFNLLNVLYQNPPAYHQTDHAYWTQTPYWHTNFQGNALGLVYDDNAGTWVPVRALYGYGGPTKYEDWLPDMVTTEWPVPPKP